MTTITVPTESKLESALEDFRWLSSQALGLTTEAEARRIIESLADSRATDSDKTWAVARVEMFLIADELIRAAENGSLKKAWKRLLPDEQTAAQFFPTDVSSAWVHAAKCALVRARDEDRAAGNGHRRGRPAAFSAKKAERAAISRKETEKRKGHNPQPLHGRRKGGAKGDDKKK